VLAVVAVVPALGCSRTHSLRPPQTRGPARGERRLDSACQNGTADAAYAYAAYPYAAYADAAPASTAAVTSRAQPQERVTPAPPWP
jgi:hypothetical protein